MPLCGEKNHEQMQSSAVWIDQRRVQGRRGPQNIFSDTERVRADPREATLSLDTLNSRISSLLPTNDKS